MMNKTWRNVFIAAAVVAGGYLAYSFLAPKGCSREKEEDHIEVTSAPLEYNIGVSDSTSIVIPDTTGATYNIVQGDNSTLLINPIIEDSYNTIEQKVVDCDSTPKPKPQPKTSAPAEKKDTAAYSLQPIVTYDSTAIKQLQELQEKYARLEEIHMGALEENDSLIRNKPLPDTIIESRCNRVYNPNAANWIQPSPCDDGKKKERK